MSFGYYSPFTVQSGQVPSTQTDFPVLLIPTDTRFKTVGNGGHVQNSNGYDLRPYSDSGLTTPLTFELVPGTYNASTGTFEMWVKVPSLADGYTIYLAYGNAALTTDGSSTSTWRSEFMGVWHLGNGSTLSYADSTSNGNNGSAGGSGNSAVAGKFGGGGLSLNGSGYANMPNASSLNFTAGSSFTYYAWINPGSSVNCFSINKRDGGSDIGYETLMGPGAVAGRALMRTGVVGHTNQATADATSGLNNGAYHLIHSRVNFSNLRLTFHVDAVQQGASAAYIDGDFTNTDAFQLGARQGGALMAGSIDEARLVALALSDNWITTEYNNMNAPGTFYTLGTEQVPTSGSKGAFYYYSQRSF